MSRSTCCLFAASWEASSVLPGFASIFVDFPRPISFRNFIRFSPLASPTNEVFSHWFAERGVVEVDVLEPLSLEVVEDEDEIDALDCPC